MALQLIYLEFLLSTDTVDRQGSFGVKDRCSTDAHREFIDGARNIWRTKLKTYLVGSRCFTTSKIVKGDTHIGDAKTSHVTNIRLVMANNRRHH